MPNISNILGSNGRRTCTSDVQRLKDDVLEIDGYQFGRHYGIAGTFYQRKIALVVKKMFEKSIHCIYESHW